MDLLILGSVLMCAGLFALGGLFDGGDNSNDEDAPPNPNDIHGGKGDDSLSAEDGTLSGWRGDDTLEVSGDAHGYGNQGEDTLNAADTGQAHGGLGDDRIYAWGSATVWGDSGDDSIASYAYQATPDALVTAYGGDGNDLIEAEVGHAYGGAGSDHMTGTGFEDAPVYDGLGTTLHGGDGNDVMIGLQNAQLHGDAGNDVLSLGNGADGDGGAGNDTLTLYPSYFGSSADEGAIHATGGDGEDTFAVNMTPSTGYANPSPTIITDFNPDQDRILVEVSGTQSDGYIYDHASFEENALSGYTDVTLHWRALDPEQPELTSLLRLEGVSGLDDSSVELTSTVDPTFTGTATTPIVGDVLHPLTGDGDAESFLDLTDSYVTAGAGDDTVTTGTEGEVVADLGAGDDSFDANGAAHVVFGGEGDDTYLMDAPGGTDSSTLRSGFYGDDGNDSITIHDDGDTTDQSHGAGPGFDGGAGNDLLQAQAGTGALALDGGLGDDVLIGRAGQSFNTQSYSDDGTDDITVNLTAQDFAANGAANIRLLGEDHLTLNIDPSLQGEITFHYNTAGNGAEVHSTEIRVGGVTVAIVAEGLPLIDDAIALGDSQLAINRAQV